MIVETLSHKEALHAINNPSLAVVAIINDNELTVVFGDFSQVTISLDVFLGRPTIPDFTDLEIVDWGGAIRFGEFETTTDFIIEKGCDVDEEVCTIDDRHGRVNY